MPPASSDEPESAEETQLIDQGDADATQVVGPADRASVGEDAAGEDTAAEDAAGEDAAGEDTADEDATEVAEPADDDATAMLPPSPISPAAPPTAVLRPQVPEPTAVIPPAESARWSATARVPRGAPRDLDATEQWSPPEPGRAWWLPILLAVIGLLILLGIAYALFTSLNNKNEPQAPSTPGPSASTSAPPASTAPPTSEPPTSSTPTEPGAPYVIPGALIGLLVNEAEDILDENNVSYVAVPQTDDNAFPNTVVAISPDVGQTVAPGGVVTLYYARPTITTPSGTPSTDDTTTPSGSPSPSPSGG